MMRSLKPRITQSPAPASCHLHKTRLGEHSGTPRAAWGLLHPVLFQIVPICLGAAAHVPLDTVTTMWPQLWFLGRYLGESRTMC